MPTNKKASVLLLERLTIGSIAIKGAILFPKGRGFCSNRRLPIGAEKISLSDLRDSAVKPGSEGVEF